MIRVYERSLVAECDVVLEICDSNRASEKKRIILIGIVSKLKKTIKDSDKIGIF